MNSDSPQLKLRSDLHLARRIWHAVGVLTVTAVYILVERSVALALLSLSVIVFIVPDVYRLSHPRFNQFFVRRLRLLLRDSEANSLSGVTFIIIGIYVTIFLFPKPVATLSLLFLALGDPAASIFGVMYGKDKLIGNKSLQGASAAFLVCATVALIFYLVSDILTERLVLATILSGLIGACSETISIKRMDDNLTFPILSGFFLLGLFHLFGAYS
jgi:diacylglycerol kinase (CTP)